MDGAVDALRKEFGGLRTGRASPACSTDHGRGLRPAMPLNQVGDGQRAGAADDHGQVWDRGMVKAVEKAIRDAGLGLNPQSTARTCASRSRR